MSLTLYTVLKLEDDGSLRLVAPALEASSAKEAGELAAVDFGEGTYDACPARHYHRFKLSAPSTPRPYEVEEVKVETTPRLRPVEAASSEK